VPAKDIEEISKQGVAEASYPGNLGVIELIQFFREHPNLITDYKILKQKKGSETALKWALSKMQLELEPVIQDSAINELKTKITDNDIRRIIKDKLAIDAETGEEAMRRAIDKMTELPSTLYVKTQAAQLMMLYKAAKMSIGGEHYRKLSKLTENFADGRNPKDKGDSARHGIPKKASIAQLKKIRSSDTASPRKKQLAHWQINMRQGRKKK